MSGRIAGVELGGTKCIAVLEQGGVTLARRQVATTTSQATLGVLAAELARWHAASPLAAVGVAGFGPLHLDPTAPSFGRIGVTPKAGWSGADFGALRSPASRSPSTPTSPARRSPRGGGAPRSGAAIIST